MALTQVIEGTDGKKSVVAVACDCITIGTALQEAEELVSRAEAAAEQAAASGGVAPIDVVEAPVFTLPASVSIVGQTVSFSVTARPLLSGASISFFTVDVPALDITRRDFTASSNSATVSFAVPAGLPEGSVLAVEIFATDSLGNKSKVTSHSVSVEGFDILAPTITVPANNAELDHADNVVVTGSAFATSTGETDTHIASDWQMASDAAMTQIVQQALNSKDLVQHTFTGLTLDVGNYYYLRTRYQGRYGGWSPYSGVSTFKMKAGYIDTPGGRTAYRHDSDKGTVLIFDDYGETVYMLIADAAYRGTAKWLDKVNIDTSLPNYTNIPLTKFNGSSSDITTTIAATITDAQLNSLFGSNRDINSGKQNTDILVTNYASRAEAANFCRSVVIDGRGCDLCNIQRLARVYCEADFLDTMDPTVGSYPDRKLYNWRFDEYHVAVWSSTEYNDYASFSVIATGYCGAYAKNSYYIVIPIQELSI